MELLRCTEVARDRSTFPALLCLLGCSIADDLNSAHRPYSHLFFVSLEKVKTNEPCLQLSLGHPGIYLHIKYSMTVSTGNETSGNTRTRKSRIQSYMVEVGSFGVCTVRYLNEAACLPDWEDHRCLGSFTYRRPDSGQGSPLVLA